MASRGDAVLQPQATQIGSCERRLALRNVTNDTPWADVTEHVPEDASDIESDNEGEAASVI
jgi:hypothetical protein